MSHAELLPSSIRQAVNLGAALFEASLVHNPADNNSKAVIEVRRVKPVELLITTLKSTAVVSEKYEKMLGEILLAKLWNKDALDPEQALELYLSIVAYFYGASSLARNNIYSPLKIKGFNLAILAYNVDLPEEQQRLIQDAEEADLCTILGWERLDLTAEAVNSMLYTTLLLMGKNLIGNTCQIWYQKRAAKFAVQVGIIKLPTIPSINLKTAKTIYIRLRSLHDVRCACFRMIQRAAQDQNRWTTFAITALSMLSFTEMEHIQVIYSTIICDYPELLRARHLQGQAGNMLAAFRFLQRVEIADRAYIKLIYPVQKTKVLHRCMFPLICDAAYAVAAYQSPSLRHYRGTDHAPSEIITEMVNNYMSAIEEIQLEIVVAETPQTYNRKIITGINPSRDFFKIREVPEDNSEGRS